MADVAVGPEGGTRRAVPATVIEMLVQAAVERPDSPAIIFDDGLELTSRGLLERSEAFAGYLASQIEPGQRVACALQNRVEYFVAWFATVAAGGVFVAVNPDLALTDGHHVLSDSGAVLAVCDEESSALVRHCQSDLPGLRAVLVLDRSEPDGLASWQGTAPLSFASGHIRSLDGATNIYYTSGSTGKPKGCLVGDAYWRQLVEMQLRDYPILPGDRLLCCLRFFYNDPSWMLLASLLAGEPLVAMRQFSVSRFWPVVHDFGITQLFTIASIPALLLTRPEGAEERDHLVRAGVQVGLDPSLQAEMTRRWGFPWVDVYGLTEIGAVAGVPLSEADRLASSGTLGRPKAGVEVKLVDSDGGPVRAGETGELLARSPGCMLGYLNRPEETAAAIDPDGWFHTGDLAREDDQGWLYFIGRQKDVVRRSGVNVSCAEVEEAIRSLGPEIIDVAVVPTPSALRGEEILAHVYTAAPDTAALAARLVTHLQQRLADYKVPRYLQFVTSDFPRLASMRIAKQELDRDVNASTWDRETSRTLEQGAKTGRA